MNDVYFWLNIVALVILISSILYHKRNILAIDVLMIFIVVVEGFISKYVAIHFGNNHSIYFFFIIGLILILMDIFYEKEYENLFKIGLGLWVASIFIFLYLLGFGLGFITRIYLIGISIVSILVISFLRYKIISFFKESVQEYSYFFDYKIILGIGLLMFYVCAFPLLFYFEAFMAGHKHAFFFQKLLKFGNLILSLSYVIAALIIWKTSQQKTLF